MATVMRVLPRAAAIPIAKTAVAKTMFLRPVFFNPQPSFPVAGTQNGNLFNDRFNANLRWYLPKFSFGGGTDNFFNFSASQTGTDSQGNPFNKGTVSFTIKKTVPDDVQAFKTANPAINVQQVALLNLTVYLTTSSTDAASGQNRTNNYTGQLTVTTEGDLQVVVDNIVGPGVIILYNNLMQKGAAASISYGYNAWSSGGQQRFFEVFHANVGETNVMAHPMMMKTASTATMETFRPIILRRPPPPPNFQQIVSDEYLSLPLDGVYNANDYSLKFTISSNGSPARPIVNVNDLTSFNTRQSEFTKLTVLGDISQKYPTLSRLYIGSLSRTIMVIPASYSIQRSTHGLTTLCQALLDSQTGNVTVCKFEFTFTVSPDISPIEFIQLSQDIANNPALQNYTVVLPTFLKEGSAPQLLSPFQNSLNAQAGIDQHSFDFGIEIRDQPGDSPATAAANILLRQLCQDQGPYLLGTIFLKLDDNFADPVPAQVVLNLHKTAPSDEIAFSTDATANTITFHNNSPLDLSVTRYGICDNNSITLVPASLTIPANGMVSTPCTAVTPTMSIVAETELSVTGVISKNDIDKYLVFQEVDVQTTKFTFGVNGSAIDFDKASLRQIDVQITLNDLPDLSIPSFSLTKLAPVNSSFALVPIQQAISSLQANIACTLHSTDNTKPNSAITIGHEFMADPIIVLQTTDIIKP